MENVITELTTTVSAANLWGIIGNAVPIIGVVVLFALGYRIVRKALKGTSKGKVSM